MIATASLPPTISNLNTYTNTSLTYQSSSTNSFTLLVNTKAESYLSLLENSYIEVSPTLTCSSISSTSIVYSISSYNGVTAPSWVAIDSSSGLLKISTPNVTSPTSCSFFIDSQVSSVTNPIQKLINLKVTKWLAQNCQKWNSLDSSKCNSWNSYYYLSNGYWGNEVKSTIKTLSITTNSIIAGATIIVILASTVHSASFSSLWAIINQLQLFLLLILTRVYLPLDVINFIIGSKIAMFPYDYIPFKKSSYSGSINDLFDSEQNDEILSKIGLESASSFVNNYSLFSSLLSAVLLHLSVIVANILLNKWEVKGKWAKPFKALKWLTQKVFTILTFGYYIRTVIESYQFLLVSSVSEINSFNVKSSSHISSLVVAFLILIVWIVFAVIAFVLASASNPKSNNEHNKLGELYAGLKNTVWARFYLALQLLRRIIFVSLLITLAPISSIAIVWAISCLQIVYLIVLIILRPFEELKDNLIEIINEVFFNYFACWLTHFNSESVWSSTTTDIYILKI